MKKIPKSCDRCGAPIVWDEVSSSIKCDFCGSKTYIRSKFLVIERIKDSAYKTFAPVSRNISNAGRALLEKQNVLSGEQVDKIGTKANKLFRNRYFKVLLLAVPITLIASSIINDPVRPYKAEIEEKCKLVASFKNTDFNAKNIYRRCSNSLYKNIRSIHKIISKKRKDFYPLDAKKNWSMNKLIPGNKSDSGNQRNVVYIQTFTSGVDVSIIYFQDFGEFAEILYIVPQYQKLAFTEERKEKIQEKKKEEIRKKEERMKVRKEERKKKKEVIKAEKESKSAECKKYKSMTSSEIVNIMNNQVNSISESNLEKQLFILKMQDNNYCIRYQEFIEEVKNNQISRIFLPTNGDEAKVIRVNGTIYKVSLEPDINLLDVLHDHNVDIAVSPS